ncbi:MAG: glycosyltransferase [Candidatus Omnitrophota bacterium]|jgi:glycosyltransferase involved in cell wall biosynthesis
MNIQKELIAGLENEKEYMGDSKPVNCITPLVSVTVTTYQHKNYIKDCLESILMQEVNFPIEIIIGEDESIDGTRDICLEYAKKHPDKIRLFLRDRKTSYLYNDKGNSVMRFNGWWTRMSARGKYISMCEGDDYWTDPHKLQTQVDFLEGHNDCMLCFHRAQILREMGSRLPEFYPERKPKEFVGIEEILECNFIATASVVFRREMLREFPDWMYRFVFADWAINLFCAQYGKIGYIDRVMSVYRVHPGGIWTSQYTSVGGRLNADTKILEFYEAAANYLDKKYRHIVDRRLIDLCSTIARTYCQLGQKQKALECLKRIIGVILKSTGISLKQRSKFVIKAVKLALRIALT